MQMYNIDFSIPYWLITYYHVIGAISLMFDVFAMCLILFKSNQIDNFRYFLLNFQIACCLTDIHLTFLMQPVPLYPLISGYVLGFSVYLGANTHHCMCVITFLFIYQIGSMIACFIKKHQAIAATLKRYFMPKALVFVMGGYVLIYTFSVTGVYATLSVPDKDKLDYVRKKYPEYLPGFQSTPTFSIYDPSEYFAYFVIYALTGGIIAFLTLVAVLLNIFRMLSILKSKISASTYQKHRTAVYSLLAQFATSSVIFVPPIFFVFIILIGINGAQIVVNVLLMIACTHSTFNMIVLVSTFPPYRKFVLDLIFQREQGKNHGHSSVSQRPSPIISHLVK